MQWVFSKISDQFIMKIGTFPENFNFFSIVVWEKIDSNILNVFIWQNSSLWGKGYRMTFHGFTGESWRKLLTRITNSKWKYNAYSTTFSLSLSRYALKPQPLAVVSEKRTEKWLQITLWFTVRVFYDFSNNHNESSLQITSLSKFQRKENPEGWLKSLSMDILRK